MQGELDHWAEKLEHESLAQVEAEIRSELQGTVLIVRLNRAVCASLTHAGHPLRTCPANIAVYWLCRRCYRSQDVATFPSCCCTSNAGKGVDAAALETTVQEELDSYKHCVNVHLDRLEERVGALQVRETSPTVVADLRCYASRDQKLTTARFASTHA